MIAVLPRLDRFAWIALFFCAFSLCTTRPIDPQRRTAAIPAIPDKIDALNARISAVQASGESLSISIRGIVYVPKKQRIIEVRPEQDIWKSKDSVGGRPFKWERK